MARIGFLGLGAMGSRMAAHLVRAGHDVTVWNRSADRATSLRDLGVREARSPAEAAQRAHIVISMLRDDDASKSVWLGEGDRTGALAAMPKDALAIECATLTPDWIRDLAAHARTHGVALIEAPVAGSRPQAEARQLIFILGGDAAAIVRADPILRTLGDTMRHVGPVGSAAAVKLAVNAMLVVQVAALAELKGFLGRIGVDESAALDALNATGVSSPALKGAAASMLAKAYAPLFPITLAQKDCSYALAAAHAVNAATPLLAAAQDVLARAHAAGFGEDHLSGVAQLYAAESQP